MKTCSVCGHPKPLDSFHKSAKARDGRQSACKTCACARQKARYESDKPLHRAQVAARQQEISDFIDSLKVGPCLDCGDTHPPYCMDFDHRPDEIKSFGISEARNRGYSKERIIAEVAKCDLLCAICHRKRTFARYGRIMEGSV